MGEPPLLLTTSVLIAFQAAVAAAKEGLALQKQPHGAHCGVSMHLLPIQAGVVTMPDSSPY